LLKYKYNHVQSSVCVILRVFFLCYSKGFRCLYRTTIVMMQHSIVYICSELNCGYFILIRNSKKKRERKRKKNERMFVVEIYLYYIIRTEQRG